jgi:hypothetical protein
VLRSGNLVAFLHRSMIQRACGAWLARLDFPRHRAPLWTNSTANIALSVSLALTVLSACGAHQR